MLQGNWERAEELYRQGIQLDPSQQQELVAALLPVYCEKVRAVLRGCCWLMACWLVLSSRLLLLLQLRYQ